MDKEQLLQRLSELLDGYDHNIKQIEDARRAGEPATVFGDELSTLVAVCADIERLIAEATGRQRDEVGEWLQSLRE
jgi:hypothetical protein